MLLDSPNAFGRLSILPPALLPASGGQLRIGLPFGSPLRSTWFRFSASPLTVPPASITWLRNSNPPCGLSKSRCLIPNPGSPFDRVPWFRYPVRIPGSPGYRKSHSMLPGFNLQIILTDSPKAATRRHFPVLPAGIICLRCQLSLSEILRRGLLLSSSYGKFRISLSGSPFLFTWFHFPADSYEFALS